MIVLHLDMDAFFAAIEEREHPELKGKPVVIGADPKVGKGRGVVSTCNYEARRYGMRSAMPISKAWQLCPQAVFLPVRSSLYWEVSERIMDLLKIYALPLEQVSVDEAYLDLSSLSKNRLDLSPLDSFDKAKNLAQEIKTRIFQKEALTCSIGIGPNKLIAKVASDLQKPDGLTVILPEEVEDFLEPLSIRVIPGIGPKTEYFLHSKGIKTIGQLKQIPTSTLKQWFGRWGEVMAERAQGRDERPVGGMDQAKSLCCQLTFQEDTDDKDLLFKTLMELTKQIWKRAKDEGILFRTITVMIRFANFETHTKSHTLKEPTDKLQVLRSQAMKLLLPFFDRRNNPGGKKFRLLGVRVSHLSPIPEEVKRERSVRY